MISNEIINVLEYLAQKIGLTIDWTSENVLPYVEQLFEKFIAYEIATSFAWIGIGMVILALTLIIFFPVHKIVKDDFYSRGIEWVILISGVVTAMLIICTQIFDIIECKVFPEKTIYEYIQMMLNSK